MQLMYYRSNLAVSNMHMNHNNQVSILSNNRIIAG